MAFEEGISDAIDEQHFTNASLDQQAKHDETGQSTQNQGEAALLV